MCLSDAQGEARRSKEGKEAKDKFRLLHLQKSAQSFDCEFQHTKFATVRRVKCDEARPSCLRCASTGRKCDGYASLAAATSSICPAVSVTNVFETKHELRLFSYFADRVSELMRVYVYLDQKSQKANVLEGG